MVSLISEGAGPERYSLRFAVDIPHGAYFSLDSDHEFICMDFLGRRVQLQSAPFGVMIFANNFPNESDARNYGDRIRLACQLLSLRQAIPVFTTAEPSPIFEVAGLLESLDKDARKIDGMAMQMSYTIIPEHQVIMNYGELRGNLVRLVLPEYFSQAFSEVGAKEPVGTVSFNDSIDVACNFWSVSCANRSDVVGTVNIVAALEVLAAGAGIKANREAAVRQLLDNEWPVLKEQFADLPKGHSVASFCKELFRRRNELVHKGRSPMTALEVSLVATDICRALILLHMDRHYFRSTYGRSRG